MVVVSYNVMGQEVNAAASTMIILMAMVLTM